MYMKLKRQYRILSKEINKEIADKIIRFNKNISILEMNILEAHKIGNQFTMGIIEIKEYTSLDKLLRLSTSQ